MSGEMRISLFYLAVLGAFWIALIAVGVAPFSIDAAAANLILYLSAWLIFLSLHALVALARTRPDRPLAFLRQTLFGTDYRQRLAQSWPLLATAILFLPGFSSMKSAIPLFNAYSWDQTFIDLDIALHGQDAWRLIHPLVGYPIVTFALSIFYQLWILLIYAGTIYIAFHVRDRALRMRYFAAYFGIWTVNGVLLAIAFASVGPCFLEPLFGDHHFDGLMAYLHGVNQNYPIMALDVQQLLIDWYRLGSFGLGRGISAMPSMHVALAFLFWLAVRRIRPVLGHIFFVYALIVLIGSVHLAYHYAVDGYLAIAVTCLVWLVAGRWVAGLDRDQRPEEQAP